MRVCNRNECNKTAEEHGGDPCWRETALFYGWVKKDAPPTATIAENNLIRVLVSEAGQEYNDEHLDDFRSNHSPEDIRDAASGDVAALMRLRQACGLKLFR